MGVILDEVKKKVKKTLVKKVEKKEEVKAVNKTAVSPEAIAKKAYELYEKRGYLNGFAEQDWIEAKRLLEAGE